MSLLLLPWLLPHQSEAVKEFNAPLIIPLFKENGHRSSSEIKQRVM